MADPILDIRGLSKSFGALKATDDVTLDLRPGEIHALIGPNGAGKSTLIKQISGEIAPDAGEVRLRGRSLSGIDAAGRARMGMARSFQVSSVAPEFSVLQNVVLAAQGASGATFRFFRPVMRDAGLLETARDCIAQAGLSGRETVPAAELAHGERRKLEIAMALALRPALFLLDEPMAGMGTEGATALGDLLDALRHRAPILLVEHDMDAVFRLSDRVSVLVYGRVIATGTPDEIRTDREVQRVYLGEEA
ncbi:ABC transporter ATP-binding protein [Limimaricola cinnabarinus]|jgi:branched-chain amino acid transport system ATP-binding protein|uniref:ABC transporter ATP-binding protein n=1 Tax=Limimaricola cinnabarinus TaxID=1125964 RepID=A0A2G1MGU0_9RHOB|nr:ABC transporter ATP-binding protein [Limimaricola cinnabarinus]PHP27973.1 ABC transporter ATP-binding protein [Limimaricola cinnabarinus]